MAALAPALAVSVDEYLHSTYEPDMDFVDGFLEDRNLGEIDHYRVQRALLLLLAQGEAEGGYYVVQETRMQVSPTRFRVPDTCLLPSDRIPKRIIREAPLLCIEVVSPEDRVVRLQRRCQDYLDMGVPEVWIVDSQTEIVHLMRGDVTTKHRQGALDVPGTSIDLQLSDLFNK